MMGTLVVKGLIILEHIIKTLKKFFKPELQESYVKMKFKACVGYFLYFTKRKPVKNFRKCFYFHRNCSFFKSSSFLSDVLRFRYEGGDGKL